MHPVIQNAIDSTKKLQFWPFKGTRTKLNTISILGEEVEVVEAYRYLGVRWTTDQTRKATQRLSKGTEHTLLLEEA